MPALGGYITPAGGGGGTGGAAGTAGQLTNGSFNTAEMVSGGKAVAFTQSGTVQIARAGVSGRMPAVGIAIDNILSGQGITIYRGGSLYNVVLSGTPFNFSGWPDQPCYVGWSGDVIASGAPTNSGDIHQIIGVSISQSGMMVQLGDALEPVAAGSGDIASGAVNGQAGGGFFCIGSGSLGTYDLASGASIQRAQNTAPIYSGMFTNIITGEIISGGRTVCISQSGFIQQAMCAVSGRMPAIGLVIDNVASGIQANVYSMGAAQFSSGMNNYSGYLNQRIFVGRSGQVVQLSGSWTSGGFASGDIGQMVGVILNSGGAWFNFYPFTFSGGPIQAVNTFGAVAGQG